MKSKKSEVTIPTQVVDDAFRAMTDVSSLLQAAARHNHDITTIKRSLQELGGLKSFDQKAGALFAYLPKEEQSRIMER